MNFCRECNNREEVCGPLSRSGECLECELTASDARDLETLRELAESGYEGEKRYSPSRRIGCPECGGVEFVEQFGLVMCASCGRITQQTL